jgi:RNA polymerase-binding protein DksA
MEKKLAESPPPEPTPKVKTYLSSKELREFKDLLLAKRAELAGDVEHLTSEALNRKNSGVNEQSSMPIHMADLGSDTWEQDFTLGLIANEQALVREIDDALARIADRTYGMCVATDKPISMERLRAKPWAKYCIEYARLREEGRAP